MTANVRCYLQILKATIGNYQHQETNASLSAYHTDTNTKQMRTFILLIDILDCEFQTEITKNV